MIYSATVKKSGDTAGTWIVTPAYTRGDGLPAPDILALASDGISPAVNDIVLCAESINGFTHASVRSFDNNGGANPVIIATFAELFTTLCNMVVKGKMTLGEGSSAMVLGDKLATWAGTVDTALSTIIAWGATVSPPLAGASASAWADSNLSENHKLD